MPETERAQNVGPQTEGIDRVLVIVAHPDDVDFGAAGTVAVWTDAGIEVTYCLVTSGDAGGSDRTVSRADMIRLRQVEQTAAAKQVGVSELIWLAWLVSAAIFRANVAVMST